MKTPTLIRSLYALVIMLFLVTPSPVRAEEVGTKIGHFGEKAQTKEKGRWSISDWLETRDRMRVQDIWLNMHSPSPYEFYVDALYKTGAMQLGGGYQGWDFTAAAYAQMFGIEAQRKGSNLETQWLAMANFRLVGLYNQATNFTLQGGVKEEMRGASQLWNPLIGANLTVYIIKQVGVTGLYRHYFAYSQGVTNNGDRFEAGAFIDFSMVRIHADFFAETAVLDPSRSFGGFQLGARLYF
jgi:hypothetical protein